MDLIVAISYVICIFTTIGTIDIINVLCIFLHKSNTDIVL